MGVVINTGDDTVMGHIATLTTEIQPQKTPLGIEIDRFVFIITVVSVVQGLVLLGLARTVGECADWSSWLVNLDIQVYFT